MSYNPSLDLMLAAAIRMITGDATGDEKLMAEMEQDRAINNCELPKFMLPNQEAFEALGIKFEEIEGDPVLCKAYLPEGWTLEHKERDTNLIDEKGRKRAWASYNGAYGKRYGEMKLLQRYSPMWMHIDPMNGNSPVKAYVVDADGSIIFETEESAEYYSDEYFELYKQAENYLTTHYPDWRDVTKYWD